MKAANTPSLLQHPFHKHALIFQELSESFRFQCQICRFFAKGGPAYHCIEYCGFFIHRWCAELPPEIQHPSHPQHPLALIYSRKECFCSGCEDLIHYECRYSLLLDKFLNKNGPNSDSSPYAIQKLKSMGYWTFVFYKLFHFFLFN
ncbi:hypothetical protein CDL15_Pgr000435 [Punica granatum]|uniref:DC1 domain-containing protein n=1 Tax=Punica granatum TaxID=22663 RepID=A0A218W356_PUNGR|nr:hypothetical protein CDL15_Pgr000435 [Punica granatum]